MSGISNPIDSQLRTRSAFHVLPAIVLSALLANCGRENEPPAQSPQQVAPISTAMDTTPAPPAADESRLEPASRDESPGLAATPAEPTSAKLSDAEIAAISDAANSAEVEQAKIAKTKAANARVKKFAQMMLDHHGQAIKDQARVTAKLGLTPAESSVLADLRSTSDTTLAQLQAAPSADFDRVYMDSQVEGHRKVLDTIDRQLLPNAQSSELKQLLETLRPRVEAHLKQATDIQQSLQTGASAPKSGAAGAAKSDASTSSSGAATGSGNTQAK